MSIVNFVNSETHEVFFDKSVARYFINSLKYRPMKKFGYKQASIVDWHTPNAFHFLDPLTGEIMEFQVTALMSYSTMVCCYIMALESDNRPHYYCIEWHGYSSTTSKQVTQWKHEVEKNIRGFCKIKYITFDADWD